MPGNAAFHPTIKTMGFQTDFSVNYRYSCQLRFVFFVLIKWLLSPALR
jgi:hypothetical protein